MPDFLVERFEHISATADTALLRISGRWTSEQRERLSPPLLDDGTMVLLDRFVDSSLAYQGVARGLGIDAVRAINDFGTGGLVPDRTLLLRVDPAAGRARQGGRGEAPDRLEQEGDAFFAAIAAAYEQLAAAEPHRFSVLDATLAPDAVLASALDALGET